MYYAVDHKQGNVQRRSTAIERFRMSTDTRKRATSINWEGKTILFGAIPGSLLSLIEHIDYIHLFSTVMNALVRMSIM